MKTCIAAVLLLVCGICFSQVPPGGRPENPAAYPESDAAAAWRALGASYVRKALKDHTLDQDPVLNARADRVMAAVGAAAAAIDPRFAKSTWTAILINDFGHGAASFLGETILVDAKFVRKLALTDDELALIFCHEVAHVLAGHASEKLSFMAEILGKDKVPTARTALLEFLAQDSYAAAFQPRARLQEREADSIGAAILFASGYDAQRALRLFDKLQQLETGAEGPDPDAHDAAGVRKRAVAGVIAELQQLDARRVPKSR
jgi:predicted Zn-dependent protease